MESLRILVTAILVILFTAVQSVPIERRVSYTGHRVLRVLPTTWTHIQSLLKLTSEDNCDVEFWGDPHVNHTVDLRVGPHSYSHVTSFLSSCEIPYEVEIEDLQWLIDHENDNVAPSPTRRRRSTVQQKRRPRASSYFYWFSVVGRYATYSEIKDWLYYATYAWPRLATIVELGYTYESRPMLALKIGKPSKVEKPAIWIDGGVHAREWISPAVVCYLIHVLLDGYGTKRNITELVDRYDWYFLPVANPDGYQYTHNVDRLWRKTRSRPIAWLQRRCNGVDLNRNFDYHWMGHCDPMYPQFCQSDNPCGSSYAGVNPFSEIEARNIANFLYRHKDAIKLYLSLHSYSQMWLTPWGYTDNPPRDIYELMRVAQKAVQAMKKVHGTDYRFGSPSELLYTAGGGSFDWAKGVAGIQNAYAIELRDTGRFGFLLPSSQIIPTGQEMWQGVQAVARELTKELTSNKTQSSEPLTGDILQSDQAPVLQGRDSSAEKKHTKVAKKSTKKTHKKPVKKSNQIDNTPSSDSVQEQTQTSEKTESKNGLNKLKGSVDKGQKHANGTVKSQKNQLHLLKKYKAIARRRRRRRRRMQLMRMRLSKS